MLLAIDVGNTTVGLYGLEDGRICCEAHFITDSGRTVSGCKAGLRDAFLRWGLGEEPVFDGVALTSVVPDVTPAMYACAERLSPQPILLAGHGLKTGLTLGVPHPEKVGVDRLMDAAAAADGYPLPVITVDMGTATTFNVVDRDRVFRGCAIVPGLLTGLEALHEKTAQLPLLEPAEPPAAIGKDTEGCILSGAVLGAAALIDGMAARFEAELGEPATLVITGGLSRWTEPHCLHPHIRDRHLLVKGLDLLYRLNPPETGR